MSDACASRCSGKNHGKHSSNLEACAPLLAELADTSETRLGNAVSLMKIVSAHPAGNAVSLPQKLGVLHGNAVSPTLPAMPCRSPTCS